jgi:glycosyltransferase involved in cell wall biosynthesis
MSRCYQPVKGLFAVAGIARWDGDNNALALANQGLLRFCALGTRRGVNGVPAELTRLNPTIGLAAYLGTLVLSPFQAESLRHRLHPWLDRWVGRLVQPGDHLISSFGFTNRTFKWVRAQGGKTFYSAGNSHPEDFWNIVEEEHRRWNCPYPPIARHQHERALAMMESVDYVLSPSSYVTRSYLAHGFRPAQILRNVYPVDLACFSPPTTPRPRNRPLTVICTGGVSLRKGAPYLLEAFGMVLKKVPDARLMLTVGMMESLKPVLARHSGLPIDWAPGLPHPQLADRLRSADIFVLPSLEDGFARTVTEALACGLPAIVTPNTGACDLIQPGVNGEIVPIRDATALTGAILKWWDRIRSGSDTGRPQFDTSVVSFAHFEREFMEQLAGLGLIRHTESPVATAGPNL